MRILINTPCLDLLGGVANHYLGLKDFWSDGENGVAPYDLIGKSSEARKKTNFEFRPIGYGVQDIPSIIKASEEAGAEWLIVEQDESSVRPTMEAARMSIEYLHSL